MAPRKNAETWKSVVKAICIKALATGNFYLVCLAFGFAVWCKNIDSAGWVRIAEIAFTSGLVCAIGWIVSFLVVCASGVLIKFMRQFYLDELKRLTEERNRLQNKLADTEFTSSTRSKPSGKTNKKPKS